MENKELSNIGDQIRDSVQDAIDSMDFKQLNKTISNTVNTALDETKSRLSPGYQPFQTSFSKMTAQRKNRVRVNQPRRVAGILYTVFGSIGLCIMLIILLAVWIVAMVAKPLMGVATGVGIFLFVLACLFGIMLKTGISITRRLKRARIYGRQAEKQMYCSIKELAGSVSRSCEFVVKDVQKMLDQGIFPEGYLDEQKTCLMLSKDIYKQYLECQNSLKEREKEEARKVESSKIPAQLEQMMAEGRNYLRILREANEAIPGEVISQKLYHLEDVIQRIFDSVCKHPEQMEEIERFMDYYLPTTVKLVSTYRDFDSVGSKGTNIVSAKKEIEDTLDTINQAFERLLDDLYQDEAFDITTDASVLQTMLKKEGWAESDFTGGKKDE